MFNQTASYGDIDPNEMWLSSDLERCFDLYFNRKYFKRTRETLCMRSHFNEDVLKGWAESFNLYLYGKGEPQKSLKDWSTHLSNWLKFQNLQSNPKDLNNVAGNQKTGTTYTRANSAEANNNRQREADDQINRLFGDG